MRFLSLSLLMAACSLPLLAEEAAPHGVPADDSGTVTVTGGAVLQGAPGNGAVFQAAPAEGVVVVAEAEADAQPVDAAKRADATYLGLMTESIPLTRAQDLLLPAGTGLSVAGIAPNSPAAKAGFQNGDVLAKLGDQLLVNPAQLRVLMRLQKAGDSVAFQIVRKGKPQEIKAVLGSRKMPELAPGGEEPRMLMPRIAPGQLNLPGAVQIMPLGDGELPPEILKQLPPEIREQLKRAGMLGAPPAKLHGVEPEDGADGEGADTVIQGGAALAEPGPGGDVTRTMTFNLRSISNDGTHTVEIEHGARERLRITGKDGKELYNGAIPANDKEWEKVPEEVRAKAKAAAAKQPAVIQGMKVRVGGGELKAEAPKTDGKPADKAPEEKPGQSF